MLAIPIDLLLLLWQWLDGYKVCKLRGRKEKICQIDFDGM